MFFSAIEIVFANFVDDTTPYTSDLLMEKVIEAQEEMLKNYFISSITNFTRPILKNVTF